MSDPYKLADRLQELYKGMHITEAANLLKKQADELKYANEMFEKSMEMIAKLMGEKRGY
jgi:uncharacterized phage infection (PIP) family protein YhgE